MIDHDQLFKRLLREFFIEFIELFLPEVRRYLDPTSISFIDKEIFAGGKPGEKAEKKAGDRRLADLVVKGKFKDKEAYFLIHVEPESSRRRKRGEFSYRMFDYFAILTREHRLPVYPIAILSYDKPRDLESGVLRVEFPDKVVLEFHFTIIQLNRLNWRDYLRQDNPVASALMAKMGFAPEERVEVKKECLRMIARLKLDRERSRLLTTFVDTYLEFSAEENKILRAEIENLPEFEREETMELTTSWYREGLQEGLQRERELVLRQLVRRIGALSKRVEASVRRLSIEQLETLGEALLDFTDARDLTRWLRENASNNGKAGKQKNR
jgi:hypothetical protein